jgi:hypothetical protein
MKRPLMESIREMIKEEFASHRQRSATMEQLRANYINVM